MWDTVQDPESTPVRTYPVSHFLKCPRCGHEVHTYLACSESCPCAPVVMPGSASLIA